MGKSEERRGGKGGQENVNGVKGSKWNDVIELFKMAKGLSEVQQDTHVSDAWHPSRLEDDTT